MNRACQQLKAWAAWATTPKRRREINLPAKRIDAFLEEMPKEERDPLVLRYARRMDDEPIAELLGVSVQAARNRVNYAEWLVKREFEEDEHLEKVLAQRRSTYWNMITPLTAEF